MMDPILITGRPRSGTSLVAGILASCGAWAGATFGPSPWNAKGTFENKILRERLVKPYLIMSGYDPLGLDPFPREDPPVLVDPGLWREKVFSIIRGQGYRDGPWIFKECKMALFPGLWKEAFPDAVWIVVSRSTEAVVDSCLRAEPTLRRLGPERGRWEDWAEAYLERLGEITPDHQITPQADIMDGTDGIKKLVEDLGLTWRGALVESFRDHSLWGGDGMGR